MPKGRQVEPTYTACASKASRDAAKALAVARSLKRLVNTEIKCLAFQSGSSVSSAAMAVVQASAIAQGDTGVTRDGDSIRILKHSLLLYFVQNASATQTSIRCTIVRDHGAAGAVPAVTDIWLSASVYAPLACTSKSRDRFTILYDKIHILNENVASVTQATSDQFSYNAPHHVHYVGVDSTDASAGKGTIWVCLLSNEATNTPTYSVASRFEFVDN
jgi:hypothetical protein